jgi:hypothetical protein
MARRPDEPSGCATGGSRRPAHGSPPSPFRPAPRRLARLAAMAQAPPGRARRRAIPMPPHRRGGAALRHSRSWIRAVMRAESAGDVRAISSAGAMGLMQVMPDTWAELRVRHRSARSLRPARQHPRGRGLSARNARPLRQCRRDARGLQCRSRPLRRVSLDRPSAAGRNARLCRRARAVLGGADALAPVTVAAADPPPGREAPLFVVRPPRSRSCRSVRPAARVRRRLRLQLRCAMPAITAAVRGLFRRPQCRGDPDDGAFAAFRGMACSGVSWRARGGEQATQPHDGEIKGREVRLGRSCCFSGVMAHFARCA